MEASNCWYDQCLVKLCLLILPNIWEIGILIYLTVCTAVAVSPRIVVGFPRTWFLRGHCYFPMAGRISLSNAPGVTDVRYHNSKHWLISAARQA